MSGLQMPKKGGAALLQELNAEAAPTPDEPDLQESKKESNVARNKESMLQSNLYVKQERNKEMVQESKRESNISILLESMANTPLRALNFRIPEGFNDWLDGEVYRLKKSKVSKQDLIIRALKLLVSEMEAEKDAPPQEA